MAEIGSVKWFNETKGYGFIREDAGRTVFVRHVNIEMDGYRTLKPGMRVAFEVQEGPNGVEATKVSLVR